MHNKNRQETALKFTEYISNMLTYSRPKTEAEGRFAQLVKEAKRIMSEEPEKDLDQLLLFEEEPRPEKKQKQIQLFN